MPDALDPLHPQDKRGWLYGDPVSIDDPNVTDYARRRANGEAIPAEVKKTAARVVCLTVSTTLLERALRADERDVVLAAICDALGKRKGAGI